MYRSADDIPLAQAMVPPLMSAQVVLCEVWQRVAQRLLGLIDDSSIAPVAEVAPVHLIQRGVIRTAPE